jgi:hypothetical protein
LYFTAIFPHLSSPMFHVNISSRVDLDLEKKITKTARSSRPKKLPCSPVAIIKVVHNPAEYLSYWSDYMCGTVIGVEVLAS